MIKTVNMNSKQQNIWKTHWNKMCLITKLLVNTIHFSYICLVTADRIFSFRNNIFFWPGSDGPGRVWSRWWIDIRLSTSLWTAFLFPLPLFLLLFALVFSVLLVFLGRWLTHYLHMHIVFRRCLIFTCQGCQMYVRLTKYLANTWHIENLE